MVELTVMRSVAIHEKSGDRQDNQAANKSCVRNAFQVDITRHKAQTYAIGSVPICFTAQQAVGCEFST